MRLISGKIKLLSMKGPWKGYQATIIKSKLKGYIIHAASMACLSPERAESTSGQWRERGEEGKQGGLQVIACGAPTSEKQGSPPGSLSVASQMLSRELGN